MIFSNKTLLLVIEDTTVELKKDDIIKYPTLLSENQVIYQYHDIDKL